MIVWTLFPAGVALYAVASGAFLLGLASGRETAPLARAALATAAVLHITSLIAGGPKPTTLAGFTLLLAAAVAILALALDLARGTRVLSLAAAPMALATVSAAWAFELPWTHPPTVDPTTFWAGLHVILVLLSYALFALTFLAGLLYLAARRALKSHAPSPWLERLPSLETSHRVNRGAALAGFLCLTAGILVGYLHARNVVAGNDWRLDPKVLLATFTWACYLVVLVLHAVPRTRGRSSVVASIGSFAAVLLSLGASIAWSGFHRFE